jgi:uncharacterized protein YciI
MQREINIFHLKSLKMRPTAFCLIITSLLFIGCSDDAHVKHANTDSVQEKKDTMVYGEMKQYWLVLLKKGENREQDSVTRARIQKAHIANIERLASEKVIIMAGPMGHNYPNDLKGIFIMDAKDSATAASHINTDSAIITGRLKFEIHPWWTAQGKYEFK